MTAAPDEYDKLRQLSEVAEALMLADSYEAIGTVSVEYIHETFGMAAGFWKYNTQSTELEPVVQNQQSEALVPTQPAFQPGESLACDLFSAAEIEVFGNVREQEGAYNPESPFRSEAFVPISTYGLLIVGDKKKDQISKIDTEILDLLANILISTIERIHQEESFRVSQDVYERIFRHNIRNRVNIIRGFAQQIQDEAINETVAGHIDRIIEASHELQQTAESVETLQRVIQSPQERRAVEITAVIEEICLEFEHEYETTIDCDFSEPLVARCHVQIADAIEELVENALLHNDLTETTVSIQISLQEGFVHIEISDTGSGIPVMELQALRKQRETALQHGSGLGLWVSDRIVHHSGGSLAFETDDGTTATIVLPEDKTDEESEQSHPVRPPIYPPL